MVSIRSEVRMYSVRQMLKLIHYKLCELRKLSCDKSKCMSAVNIFCNSFLLNIMQLKGDNESNGHVGIKKAILTDFTINQMKCGDKFLNDRKVLATTIPSDIFYFVLKEQMNDK